MQLLLVRHAIAYDISPLRWPRDTLRPLTARGMRRMQRAAKGFTWLTLAPQRVCVSPLLRATQTAAILEHGADWPAAKIWPALAPAAPLARLLRELASLRDERVALIGHQPQLGRLLGRLLTEGGMPACEFRKGGAACVSFSGAVRPGKGRLLWLMPPRALRRLARS